MKHTFPPPSPYAGLNLKWQAAGPEPSVSIPGVGADEPGQMQRLECVRDPELRQLIRPFGRKTFWDPSSLWQGSDSDTLAHMAFQLALCSHSLEARVEGSRRKNVLKYKVTILFYNQS